MDELNSAKASIVVDSIFGFGFKGTPRAPFDSMLELLQRSHKTPIISVDVPSGWPVEADALSEDAIHPEMLISLSGPVDTIYQMIILIS